LVRVLLEAEGRSANQNTLPMDSESSSPFSQRPTTCPFSQHPQYFPNVHFNIIISRISHLSHTCNKPITSHAIKGSSEWVTFLLLLIPQSFDYVAAFHLELLQAILFITV
jgi:hypothetical protein